MSYEFGFEVYRGTLEPEVYNSADNLFFWCGWENTGLHDALVRYGCGTAPEFGENYLFDVNALDFIVDLYNKLTKNTTYYFYNKLVKIDDVLADEFIENLTINEKIDFALCFYTNNPLLDDIMRHLYRITIDGYSIVECLYNAYNKMVEKGYEKVIIYGG